MDFKKNLDHLSSSFFKLKNGDFKTRDFSPLIERVLAGVIVLGIASNTKLFWYASDTIYSFKK